jgi:hypothetical protein
MSRTDRYSGEASGGKNKKHRKNKYKPKKNKYRDGKLPKKQVLRKETIYVPPKSSKPHLIGNQTEVHDPARPFTVLPCEACGAVVCKDRSACREHEAPIVIAIHSKGKDPAACGVFCNISSSYNTTFMVHKGNLKFGEADLHAAIVALKKVCDFVTTVEKKERRGSPQSKRITQIAIKTSSSWLVDGFAASSDHLRYEKLALEFDNLVDLLGELNETPTVVKFWKAKAGTALQLADATLKGWEVAKARMEAEVQVDGQL